ncbi:hypothetical protein EVAR_66528_1 [Eumeta japonica]|uniref:Uncharacterized protein n=1 Tax=Eumeta variegata TaxID=151549 RepID=A0A4C1ZC86_EUMVA|nr:hypothetical protein EVAR_66528_1 [Eumeta japonica]
MGRFNRYVIVIGVVTGVIAECRSNHQVLSSESTPRRALEWRPLARTRRAPPAALYFGEHSNARRSAPRHNDQLLLSHELMAKPPQHTCSTLVTLSSFKTHRSLTSLFLHLSFKETPQILRIDRISTAYIIINSLTWM